jgi:hypothetical protein
MASFGGMKLYQLKLELELRGAKTTGRKKELVERLEAYDRNQNFNGPNASNFLPESNPLPAWPLSGFVTINSSIRSQLPRTCQAHIEQYVVYRQGIDRESLKDKSSMKKGFLMAQDEAISALSVLQCSEQGVCFFTGIVSASMKKRVEYSIKFVISTINGEITHSHCECPGGEGLGTFDNHCYFFDTLGCTLRV